MGKAGWLRTVRQRPPDDVLYNWKTASESTVHDGICPMPVLWVARVLGREARQHFPMCIRVCWNSDAYEDEHLWLDSGETRQLLDELRRLQQLCRYEQFLPGIDGRQLSQWWLQSVVGASSNHELDDWLNRIEAILEDAVTNGWWTLFRL